MTRTAVTPILTDFNFPRFDPVSAKGHYESWFLRANHPSKPLAVWIRYTIFKPLSRPEASIGELWAIYFDGIKGAHRVAKSEFPIGECQFSGDPFRIQISRSVMSAKGIQGRAGNMQGKEDFLWDLSWKGNESPVFLFPENLYAGSFPKAKVLVGSPNIKISGSLRMGRQSVDLKNWVGSHNHNWGSKHTDQYAWGQVVGFDNDPTGFLELATAKIKVGPLWTPALTPVVLRLQGEEFRLNQLTKCFRRAHYRYFDWTFHAQNAEIELQGRIHAKVQDFACLKYNNPPGGWKFCLNSKIANADLLIQRKKDRVPFKLNAKRRAAFEILTDDTAHGLRVEV